MLLFGSQPEPERRADEEFRAFWEQYPRRVGKLAAQAAYQKARKMASAADILAGVERYKEHKPEYADWCHPVTFLRQGRWLDEYETVSAIEDVRSWCQHPNGCPNREYHENILRMEARNKANV